MSGSLLTTTKKQPQTMEVLRVRQQSLMHPYAFELRFRSNEEVPVPLILNGLHHAATDQGFHSPHLHVQGEEAFRALASGQVQYPFMLMLEHAEHGQIQAKYRLLDPGASQPAAVQLLAGHRTPAEVPMGLLTNTAAFINQEY